MKRNALYVILIIILYPSIALADGGTPLMWATSLHLLFGNAILGIVEALIIARVFRLRFKSCVLYLIAANYFSAWVGIYFIGFLRESWKPDIYNGMRITLQIIAVTYVLTLLLEWPFIAVCLRKCKRWLWKSVVASLLVQSITYIVLFVGYKHVGVSTLYNDFTLVRSGDITLPADIEFYYISDKDGHIYHRSFPQTTDTLIYTLGSNDDNDHLVLQESKSGIGWDLGVTNRYRDREHVEVILPGVLKNASEYMIQLINSYNRWNQVPQIGTAADSAWHFRTSHWGGIGFRGENEVNGKTIRVSIETHALNWSIARVIQLPEDMILFQLGEDQICVLDVESKRIALLVRGRSPIAVPKE